jgi:hypothetical protein
MASANASRVSARLPAPASRWVDSALTTVQYKEFSIRYIGFAILSSVAIGVGTAETMRLQQSRSQRQRQLLNQAMPPTDAPDDDWDRPMVELLPEHPWTDEPVESVAGGAAPTALEAVPGLDWAMLSHSETESVSDDRFSGVLTMLLSDQQVQRLPDTDNQQQLAIQVSGIVYAFYRYRPTLEATQRLLTWLQRQGKVAVTTQDNLGYGVWVRQSDLSSTP